MHANTNANAGNFETIAEALAPIGVPIITVAFGDAAPPSSTPPATAEDSNAPVDTITEQPALPELLIALCMQRVLRRKTHVGALPEHQLPGAAPPRR